MASNTDLRLGVIGAAGRGTLADHAERVASPRARLVAAADPNPTSRADFLDRHPDAAVFDQSSRMIDGADLDAVFICSPDWLHEQQAVECLEHRIAVYLEKPMAITVAGCDRILAVAESTGTPLYVGHNMRHMAWVRRMKDLIAEGAIGEPQTAWCRHFVGHGGDFYFKDWHAEKRNSTGLLLQKAVHDIDVLHWLVGSSGILVNGLGDLMVYGRIGERQSPDAIARRPKADLDNWPPLEQHDLAPHIDIEDVSMLQARCGNGALIAYQQCHFTPDYWRNYTVIGTEGRIENFGNGEPGSRVVLWNRRTVWNPQGDASWETPASSGGHGGADPAIVGEFLRFVAADGSRSTSPIEARAAVAVGCAATESLREGGKPVAVPPVDPVIAAALG